MPVASRRSALSRLRRVPDSLPWDDEQVDRLDPASRARVGSYWEGRADAELRVAAAFRRLSEQLRETGAEPSVMDLLEASIGNELYHSTLCEKLASRYLGAAIAPPLPSDTELPPLPGVDHPPTRTAIYAAGLCAINESVASVWLEHCFARATTPLIRAVNQLHLSDEIVHARLGWAHLASPSVTATMRKELSRWLVPLVRTNVGQWLHSETLRGAGVPDHGIPDPAEQRSTVLGAFRNVVIPGFDHVGLDVAPVARWFRAEFG